MNKSYNFNVSLDLRGERLDVFCNEANHPQSMHLFSIKGNRLLKYAKIKEHESLARDTSEHFLITLKSSLYRHILKNQNNLSPHFKYPFEYIAPQVSEPPKKRKMYFC